jgi:hypothetical protein
MKQREEILKQVEDIIEEYNSHFKSSKHDDLQGIPENLIMKFNIRAHAVIKRIAGIKSPYYEHCKKIVDYGGYLGYQAERLIGVLKSLQDDIKAGYLKSHDELIHGEIFSDFLEMAGYLLTEGYKDPAAVIAGSALETHLRLLCKKYEITISRETDKGNRFKQASELNNELAKLEVYSKLDHKSITAWLELRNKAAHGLYSEYKSEQVELIISGIRDFITRNPA